MLFLVQDFLDYAQIKTGKFRKNITKFNIRDTVEKVIKMQSKKALDTKIKLFASFINIGPDDTDSSQNSPMILADEKRIMQIILNL